MRALKVSRIIMVFLMLSLPLFFSFGANLSVIAKESLTSGEPHNVDVTLQRVYLDGEMSEEKLEETIWSMEDFWSRYSEWQLVDQNQSEIIFRQDVDDISPLLKMHGYFGLAEDGTLSIYHGKPDGSDVIQSFFQINTEKLKSQLYESLLEGIPVSSKEDYIQVLKKYEEYSMEL
ncbi:sporulation-like protein BofC [Salipaludibacillus neizhouensis]|uniref:Sporulation-like protein BofC n=1 Tax=Salipaludibacillus neizhouensis TaxID=885475 RepID=A0A3A9KG62_9BACI|nr:intercompartmental signaling factor BofC [Salipaludibacillus neizhouensis]RKL68553.1 sporulation-like protein BofC [Salipaludibacillus neizhouensis]